MSLGGKQTTETKIPDWLREPTIRAIERGENIAQIGYTPYYGPEVAAMTTDQRAAQQNNRDAAAAFGMNNTGGLNYLPVEHFGNGAWGFSSQPIFESAMDQFRQERPGQYDYINSFFIDPSTGGYGGFGPGQFETQTTPIWFEEAMKKHEHEKMRERDEMARDVGYLGYGK